MNAWSSPTAACATATTKHRSNNSSNGVETRPRSSGCRAVIGRYQGWVAAEGSLIAGGPIGRGGRPAADPDGPDPNLSQFPQKPPKSPSPPKSPPPPKSAPPPKSPPPASPP